MFYFKNVLIDNASGQIAENAIRQFSLKRNTPLDFQSAESDIDTGKYFIGLESKNDIKISRIRTSFERLLPKLIVSFPKDKGFTCYKIRYSLWSSLLAFFFIAAILANAFFSIRDQRLADNFQQVLLWLAVFFLLTYFELRLTNRRIQKALKATRSPMQDS